MAAFDQPENGFELRHNVSAVQQLPPDEVAVGIASRGIRIRVIRTWTIAASVAMTSTRYILVSRNYHYPLHLLLVHLSLSQAVFLFRGFKATVSVPPVTSTLPEWLPRPGSVSRQCSFTTLERVKLLLASLALSVSLPLFMQALLHFSNPPTLAMLAGIAVFWKSLCVQGLLGSLQPRSFMLRAVILWILCLVILGDDYRLTVNGCLFALPAVVLAGLSGAVLHSCLRTESRSYALSWSHLVKMVVPLSLAITVCWTAGIEDLRRAAIDLPDLSPFVIAINIMSMAISMGLGSSEGAKGVSIEGIPAWDKQTKEFAIEAVVVGVTMTGLTSLSSLILLRSGFSTSIQLAAFFASSLVCLKTSSLVRAYHHLIQRVSGGCFKSSQTSCSRDLETSSGSFTPSEMPPVRPRRSSSSSLQLRLVGTAGDTRIIEPQAAVARPFSRLGASSSSCAERRCATAPPVSRVTSMLLTGAVVVTWIVFIAMNFSGLPRNQLRNAMPTLDLAYSPRVDLDIVVSMYKESPTSIKSMHSRLKSIPSVAQRSTRLLIYVKDENVNQEELKKETGAFEIIQRPNIGREGESYLFHILSHWDDLAEQTLFVQAHVHNQWEFFRRIRQYYSPNTGMMSLGFSGNVCDCGDCGDRWGWSDTSGIIAQVYQEVHNTSCTTIPLSYKGQFIVSARRIRSNSRSLYEKLHRDLVDPKGWAHQQAYLQGRPDSLDAPYLGFTLERLWSILFQCSDLEIAWKCPSLLSGWRRGGDAGDCQCFD